jgi:hypothetical protein
LSLVDISIGVSNSGVEQALVYFEALNEVQGLGSHFSQ